MSETLMNFQAGVLSADPGSGTTLNSGNFANLPAVTAPNTMRLALDPDGIIGAPEIVIVTAHTAFATTCTVTRGQETSYGAGGTRAHPVDTIWRHVLTRASIIEMSVPAGTVVATMGATADPGYLLIDGSTVTNAQTLYPGTWARIPASWKSSANMVLPDWRGRTLFSDDTGGVFTLGGSGGSNTHAITQAELPAVGISVTITDPGHDHGSSAGAAGALLTPVTPGASFAPGTGNFTSTATTGITATSGNLGSGTAMSLLPAHGVVTFQLKCH